MSLIAGDVMGWFLTRKKARGTRGKGSGAPTKARAARQPWDPARTLAGLKLVGALALLAALAVGWLLAERGLVGHVREHRSGAVGVEAVELVDAPMWMSSLLRQDLQGLIAAQMGPDPMDATGLHDAVQALAQNPWVKQVHEVRRGAGARVEVRADYRAPVALIQGRGGIYHLVDGEGVSLPGTYRHGQLAHMAQVGVPVVAGVSARPVAPGQVWPGEELRAGLALVQLLGGEPYMDQVEAVDVGLRDSRGRVRLALRTRQGGLVRWGLPPGQEQSIEPEAAVKKKRLLSVYRTRRAIDAGGKTVDLYGATVFIHQPLGDEGQAQVGYTWSR